MIVVEPIALTEDTAVLRRRDYDALIKAYEDAADALALADVRAREAAGNAEYVPVEIAEKIFVAGEHPVRVWREHRDTPWPKLLDYWGLPNLQMINRDVHVEKCADEASWRREQAIAVIASPRVSPSASPRIKSGKQSPSAK